MIAPALPGREIFVVHPSGVRRARDLHEERTHKGRSQWRVQFANMPNPSWVYVRQVFASDAEARSKWRHAKKHRDKSRGRLRTIVEALVDLVETEKPYLAPAPERTP